MLAALGLFTQAAFHLPDDVFSNPKGLDALFQVREGRRLVWMWAWALPRQTE